ncbi:hypothetical protein [Chromohalobacter nigrandesensis]|uniref:hypothetical protein n=1 Tax=Chromohalobacter nigrandesensis TaxID=119863 RepID=UPI001FF26667|nr:hypothetical protein [Chromohalobacter nigrandesensis]MCK0744690.1 hypothetical protein [Chromohalobacter nigrandesensis]
MTSCRGLFPCAFCGRLRRPFCLDARQQRLGDILAVDQFWLSVASRTRLAAIDSYSRWLRMVLMWIFGGGIVGGFTVIFACAMSLAGR